MSNDLSIKDYELINDMLLVSFTDNTEAVVSYKKLRKMCPCASCAGETDALGNPVSYTHLTLPTILRV